MPMFCTSGFYTGPHTGDRVISLGDDQIWTPKVVIAKARSFPVSVPVAERAAYLKIDSMAGNLCHKVGIASSPFTFTDALKAVGAGQFTIGNDKGIEADASDVAWLALGGDGVITGSYTGNGGDGLSPQSIAVAGLTATPKAMIISSETGDFVTQWGSADSFKHTSWNESIWIVASSAGFDAYETLNVTGRDYYYACIVAGTANVEDFSWTGDGADDHDITGTLAFAPHAIFGGQRVGGGTAASRIGGFHVAAMSDPGFETPGATTAWTPETYSGNESFAPPRGVVLHADYVTVEAGGGDGWPLNISGRSYRGWVLGQKLQSPSSGLILPNF